VQPGDTRLNERPSYENWVETWQAFERCRPGAGNNKAWLEMRLSVPVEMRASLADPSFCRLQVYAVSSAVQDAVAVWSSRPVSKSQGLFSPGNADIRLPDMAICSPSSLGKGVVV
jgi:hypothetical protein